MRKLLYTGILALLITAGLTACGDEPDGMPKGSFHWTCGYWLTPDGQYGTTAEEAVDSLLRTVYQADIADAKYYHLDMREATHPLGWKQDNRIFYQFRYHKYVPSTEHYFITFDRLVDDHGCAYLIGGTCTCGTPRGCTDYTWSSDLDRQ